jgi:hypothetical protein
MSINAKFFGSPSTPWNSRYVFAAQFGHGTNLCGSSGLYQELS